MMHCCAIESQHVFNRLTTCTGAAVHVAATTIYGPTSHLQIRVLVEPFCSKAIHVTGIVVMVQSPISNQGVPHSHPHCVTYIMQCICHALSAAPFSDGLDGKMLLHSILI